MFQENRGSIITKRCQHTLPLLNAIRHQSRSTIHSPCLWTRPNVVISNDGELGHSYSPTSQRRNEIYVTPAELTEHSTVSWPKTAERGAVACTLVEQPEWYIAVMAPILKRICAVDANVDIHLSERQSANSKKIYISANRPIQWTGLDRSFRTSNDHYKTRQQCQPGAVQLRAPMSLYATWPSLIAQRTLSGHCTCLNATQATHPHTELFVYYFQIFSCQQWPKRPIAKVHIAHITTPTTTCMLQW